MHDRILTLFVVFLSVKFVQLFQSNPPLIFSFLALDRLNQMELVSDSNVQTEAAWFMKIGKFFLIL